MRCSPCCTRWRAAGGGRNSRCNPRRRRAPHRWDPRGGRRGAGRWGRAGRRGPRWRQSSHRRGKRRRRCGGPSPRVPAPAGARPSATGTRRGPVDGTRSCRRRRRYSSPSSSSSSKTGPTPSSRRLLLSHPTPLGLSSWCLDPSSYESRLHNDMQQRLIGSRLHLMEEEKEVKM
ncbi:unnamed protein product [Musa banksii]